MIWIGLNAFASAETIALKDGTTVEGKILMRNQAMLVVETPDRQKKYINTSDIQQIQKSAIVGAIPVPPQSSPPADKARGGAQDTQPKASSSSAKTSPEHTQSSSGASATSSKTAQTQQPRTAVKTPAAPANKLVKELSDILKYMSREPLDAWPEKETPERVMESDPAGKNWKAQRTSGAIEYLASPPRPGGDIEKVWAISRSPVIIRETVVGIGTYDRTPAAIWHRMYWHAATKDWGASHPNELGFKRRQDYALSFLNAAGNSADAETGRRLQSLWSKLINSRAGAPRDEQTVATANSELMDEMFQVASDAGGRLGLDDSLARAWLLSAHMEPRIAPNVDMAQQVDLAREQAKLLDDILKQLSGN